MQTYINEGVVKSILFILSAVMELVNPLCTPIDTGWISYTLTIAPVGFNGTVTSGGCSGTNCVGPGFGTRPSRLGDGDYGTISLNVAAVHAWERNVSITFSFPNMYSVIVRGVNLYFYNIPSRNIGLPYHIDFFSVNSTIVGNQDLNQNDNQLRNLTLIPTSVLSGTHFTIQFSFSDIDKIDWLLLTEVEICTKVTIPLMAPSIFFTDDIVSNISTSISMSVSLSCSVENEGRFTWMWTLPSGNHQPSTYILDVSRTSVLELYEVTKADNGVYQCHVDYSGIPSFHTELSAMFNITLTIVGHTTSTDHGGISTSSTGKTSSIRLTTNIATEGHQDFGGLFTGTHLLALVVGVGLGILLTSIVVCFLKKCRAKESAAEKEDGPVIYDDVIVNCKKGGGQIETKTNEAYEMASSRL